MSAQKPELVPLPKVLEQKKDRMPLLLLMSMALFIGREVLMAEGKTIKSKEENPFPKKCSVGAYKKIMISIIHYLRHQREKDPISEVNNREDKEAQSAELKIGSCLLLISLVPGDSTFPEYPKY